MAGKEDEVILQTFMIKRSQNKKLFTPVNFRERFMVLTPRALIYYDSNGEKRKERGRVPIAAIHTVEEAQLGELSKQLGDIDGDKGLIYKYPFQVGYSEQSTDYTLYLVAGENSERLHWIHTIRTVCKLNSRRAAYHPGAWASRRWPCCDAERRSANGCTLADVWPLDHHLDDLIRNSSDSNDCELNYIL